MRWIPANLSIEKLKLYFEGSRNPLPPLLSYQICIDTKILHNPFTLVPPIFPSNQTSLSLFLLRPTKQGVKSQLKYQFWASNCKGR